MATSIPNCSVCGLIPLSPTLRGRTSVVAHSPAMQATLKRVARFATSTAPVVLLGETGTGKEVLARALHANGPHANQPFVAVNVAALPGELLESELFGHAKGAFTGAAASRRGLVEAAEGGTLFLDEIGEMPLSLQAKLLRVLQDGEVRRIGETQPFMVNVRVICATHRDLAQLVRAGTFREDLYYRLKVLTLSVPPLRERREDVLPLAMTFLADDPSVASTFSEDAAQRLLDYHWPGNVRELQNAVRYGAALAVGPQVTAADLPDEIHQGQVGQAAVGPGLAAAARASGPDDAHHVTMSPAHPGACAPTSITPAPVGALKTLAEAEHEHILHVLEECGGSQSEAARILGIGRNTLWRKLRRA